MSLIELSRPVATVELTDAGLAALGVGVRMRFAAGEEIFAQGEASDLLYLVLRGCVRTTRLFSDGRRQIGDFYYGGELVGLEQARTHRYSGEAVSDCEVLVVKRAALAQYGSAGEELERLVWSETIRQLDRAQLHLDLLGRKTASERVACFLMDAAERGDDSTVLAMGRQDMADYLGLTIETVSRMITQLQADRVVRFDACRRFRILSQSRLEEVAGI